MTDFVKNANRLNELLQSAEDRLTRHNTTPSFVATMPLNSIGGEVLFRRGELLFKPANVKAMSIYEAPITARIETAARLYELESIIKGGEIRHNQEIVDAITRAEAYLGIKEVPRRNARVVTRPEW